jgi:hypothetical protein
MGADEAFLSIEEGLFTKWTTGAAMIAKLSKFLLAGCHWRPASALILGMGLIAHKLFWDRTWGAMASCLCWLLEKPL